MNSCFRYQLTRIACPILAATLLGACSGPSPRPALPDAPAPQSVPQPAASQAPAAASEVPPPGPALPAAASLATRIDAYVAQVRFRHARWGIEVVDLASGRTVYAHNAEKLFVPASNTKLYTAALALSELGPEARLTTSLLLVGGARSGSTLKGDLVLRGGGDPSLGNAQVAPGSVDWAAQMAAALKQRGITRIEGDLIGDATRFRAPEFGGGWEADDLQAAYAPPASALTTAGNLMAVTVSRDGRRCCRIQVWPEVLQNDVVDLTDRHADNSAQPLLVYQRPGQNEIQVHGDLPPQRSGQRFVLAVGDPARLAALQLRKALADQGIIVQGRVRSQYWPREGALRSGKPVTVIAQVESPPLRVLVRHMLKKSDNLFAQMLLLDVGEHFAHRESCPDRATIPATSEQWGLCAMRTMLGEIGITPDQASFSEGSGLSRRNLVSPAATTQLLRWVQGQRFAAMYFDALPVAGMDGTLKHRFRDSLAAGKLHAKTGTLTHAYALAGYVTDANGRQLAFALALDHYQRPRDAMGRTLPPSPRQELDAIAGMLAGDAQQPATDEPAAPASDPTALSARKTTAAQELPSPALFFSSTRSAR